MTSILKNKTSLNCPCKTPIKQLLKGLISSIPRIQCYYLKYKSTSNYSNSNARFCYSVWMRIFVLINRRENPFQINKIAELGSSSSLGIGIAALLTGVRNYTALEIVNKFEIEKNLHLVDELVKLFRRKESIPDDSEFSRINIKLPSYVFPHDLLNSEKLDFLLSESRINQIKWALKNLGRENVIIKFIVPWESHVVSITNEFDLIFSRAVMEHVENYNTINLNLFKCVKINGLVLHDIEFHNHGIGNKWNCHWSYSDFLWSLIKGKRKYLTNRLTFTDQLLAIEKSGFNIIEANRIYKQSPYKKNCLSKKYRLMNDADLNTYGGCIVAQKN